MEQDERLQKNQNIHLLGFHCQKCGGRVLYKRKSVVWLNSKKTNVVHAVFIFDAKTLVMQKRKMERAHCLLRPTKFCTFLYTIKV